jgi:hypothetical protein
MRDASPFECSRTFTTGCFEATARWTASARAPDLRWCASTPAFARLPGRQTGEESQRRAFHGFGPSASTGPLVVSSSVSSICIHHRGWYDAASGISASVPSVP